MAIIYTYPDLGTVDGSEKLLVSDGTDGNNTKTITTATYGAYINATYGGGSGSTIYQADGSITGNRQLSGSSLYSLSLASLTGFTVTTSSTINLNPSTDVEVGEGKGITTSNTTGTVKAIRDKNKVGNYLQWLSRGIGFNGDIATVSGEGGAVIRSGNSSYGIELTNGTLSKTTIKNGVAILSGVNNDIADITASVNKALITKEWAEDYIANWAGSTNITTLGTVTAGTWNSTTIAQLYGGTGFSSYATGDLLYASAANTLSKLTIGTANQILQVSGGIPSWQNLTVNNSNWSGTVLSITNGGTGQSNRQAAIDALTNVSTATDEYVLTKDTATGNAIWKATGSSSSVNIYNTNGTVINGRIAELAGDMTWQGSGSSEVHYTNMDALGVTDGGSISIDSGTLFQLDSTTKGFLPPRMTSAQMQAIGSPVEGLIVHATDADRPQFNNGTSWRGFGDLFGLYSQTVQSATVTGTTETSIIGTGVGALTIPANAFKVGDSFHGKIGGIISDTANGDDITLRIKTGATLLASTGVFALDTTAAAGEGWEMELDFTIATLGATGSICTNGNFAYTKTGDKKVSGTVFQDVQPIDTTIANTLDVTVEWGQDGQNIYSANFVLYRTFVGS